MGIVIQDTSYRIKAVDRALQIPSVNYLWDKSTAAYDSVKGSNQFVHWAFDTVETVVCAVIEKSLPLMEKPIYSLDRTLCQGLDFVVVKLPIIKQEPQYILNRTKSIFSERLRPAMQTFSDLKKETRIMTLRTYYKAHYLISIYSWEQIDRVMSTDTGCKLLFMLNNTTELAEVMLDKYFPAPFEEYYQDIHDICCEHAKLHHTMIKLSDFRTRASRRIYCAMTERLQYMYKIEIFILVLHALVILQAIKILESISMFFYKLI